MPTPVGKAETWDGPSGFGVVEDSPAGQSPSVPAPRMSRLPIAILLMLLAAFPAAASASSSQSMTFEAPRELLDPSTRDRTLQEISELGVDRVRVLVYWKDYAPAATSKRRPDFDAADPNAYPAGAWSRLDGLFESAQARGITVQLALTGPVPRWATKGKRDNVTSPSTKEFQAFATAVGRRFGAKVGVWSIWNEPNHPQFLLPQFVKKKAKSPRDLPQPLPRRPARAGRLGQRRRHAAVRRDRAARDPARRRAAGVPARGAVPRQELPPARPLRARRGGRVSPTTPTRRASARASARRIATT